MSDRKRVHKAGVDEGPTVVQVDVNVARPRVVASPDTTTLLHPSVGSEGSFRKSGNKHVVSSKTRVGGGLAAEPKEDQMDLGNSPNGPPRQAGPSASQSEVELVV